MNFTLGRTGGDARAYIDSMINFGIVGFGLHAVKRLMPGFALAKNCRVTALSRRDLAKAQASAREYDIPLAFDSAEKLCRSPQVDAVFIATPNAFHLRDVLLATACGKPVLCEKPMAIHADQCRQMVEAARKARVLLGVAQVFRSRRQSGVSGSWRGRLAQSGDPRRSLQKRQERPYRRRAKRHVDISRPVDVVRTLLSAAFVGLDIGWN